MFTILALWAICTLTLYLLLYTDSRGVMADALEDLLDWLLGTKLGRTVVAMGVVGLFVLMMHWPGSGGIVLLLGFVVGLWRRLRRGEAAEIWAEYGKTMKPVTVFVLRGFLVIGVIMGVVAMWEWMNL